MSSCFPSEYDCFCSPWPLTTSAASQLLLRQLVVPGPARCSGRSWREIFPKAWIPHYSTLAPAYLGRWVDSQRGPWASDCPFPAQPTASISQKVAPSPATLGGGTLDSGCRCHLASRIGRYVAPGRAAGEGALQTPKGQAEKKKKGEARREEEAKRTGTVRAVAPARPLYPPLLCLLLRARGSEPRPKACTLYRRRPSCDSSSAGPW